MSAERTVAFEVVDDTMRMVAVAGAAEARRDLAELRLAKAEAAARDFASVLRLLLGSATGSGLIPWERVIEVLARHPEYGELSGS